MVEDIKVFCGKCLFIFINLKIDEGLDEVIDWIECDILFKGLL